MRRMKIRATPNFGGVVRNAQPSSSAPVSSSSASATSVSTAPISTVAVNTISTSITPVGTQTTSTTLVDIKPLNTSHSTNASITTPVNTKPPITTPANKPPITTPANTKSPITTPVNTKPPITTPANTKPPITTPVNIKPPITTPVNTKPPITTPVNTKPPITTPVNTKPPITTPVNTKPPITTPVNTKPPITTPVNTKPPITTPVNTKPPITTPINTKPSSTSQVSIKPPRMPLVTTSLTESLDTKPSHTPVSATIVSGKRSTHMKGSTEEPGDNSSAANSPKSSSQVRHIHAPFYKSSVSPHVNFSETDKCLQRKDVVSSTEGCMSQSVTVGKKVSFASTSSISAASKFTSQSSIKSALLNTSSEPSIQIISSTVPPPQQQAASSVMQSVLAGSVSLSNESTEPVQVKSEVKSVVNARRRRMKFQPVVGGIKKEVVEKSTLESDCDLKAKLNISVVHTDEVPLQRKLSQCRDESYKPPFDDSQGQKSKHNETTGTLKTLVIEKDISESSETSPAVVILKEYTKNDAMSPESLLKIGKSAVGETQGLGSGKKQGDSMADIEVVEVPVTEESNKESKIPGVKSVENSSSTTSCKRRSKIRAMPSFFTKRKTIKKEVAIQESDHTSQTQPLVGEVGVQEDAYNQGMEKFKLATGTSVRPHLPTNKPSSSLIINQYTTDDVVSIDLSWEPEIASKSITERKTGGVNIIDIANAEDNKLVKRKKLEANKKKLSSSRAEEIEIESNETDRIIVKPGIVEQETDIVNSDDSSGDKENSARVTISHRHVKKDIDIKEHRLQAPQKRKSKLSSEVSQKKTLTSQGRRVKTEIKTESKFTDDSCDEKTEKQIFRERKEEYRKKVSRGGLEPSKLTMFDLIFWNPANNPMPGRTDTPKKRVRLSSKCDTESIASEVQEEQKIDDLGLDSGDPAPSISPPTPEEVQICESSSQPTAEPELASKDPEEEEKKDDGKGLEKEEENIFAPKVKIGPNGQIIVDEQSIKIQTTAAKNRDEILSKAEVVEENNDTSHYGRWSKKRSRSSEWTIKETARFYKALSTVGTDFSMMEALITWRSRAELKTKFKKEERINRELIDRALRDSTQFDVSLFEGESDYDPEEDRKQTRQADREEARQKRLEMKQTEKALEVKQKRLEKTKVRARNKKRKKLLKKARRAQEMKRTLEYSEDEEPAEPRTKVKRAHIKKRSKPERRNSFVIDEVTVTWECSRPPLEPSSEQTIEQTVEENCTAPMEDPLQDNKASSPSHEPGDVGSMEDTDEILPSVDELNISDVPSAALCEKYLLGSPPRKDSETEPGVIPDSYSPLHQILSEDFIIEGTVIEDESSTETPIVDDHDALPMSSGEYITGDVLTGDEHEAEMEASQPEQWLDSPIVESVTEDGSQRMWHFPVSAIQTQDDGQQVIVVPTSSGRYSVPVPVLPPGTSNIVVMATPAPDCPGEHIYHVYVMSPVEEGEQ